MIADLLPLLHNPYALFLAAFVLFGLGFIWITVR